MKINALKKTSGFTLVEIMIVVAIIGLLAAIAIPNFVKARTTAQKNACINNLRQIDGAKEQWALETKQAPGAAANQGDAKRFAHVMNCSRNRLLCRRARLRSAREPSKARSSTSMQTAPR